METMEKKAIKGGEFLIRKTNPQDIFISEEYNEEQKMIGQTCEDYVDKEILPILDRIDSQEEGLVPSLMDKAGELGILGMSFPSEYGGMGVDFVTSMLSTEKIGHAHSMSVSLSAHTGIGSLPLLYYGNDDQKQRYAPKLATGEWKAAYCLTEPSSGSDANSGKTKAVLSEDGKHYVLNGQKMWITNGGFADFFTVFAKIEDDDNLSAFLVEGTSEGISLNAEEKKMGIKGSSTVQVFFNNVKVPVENLLDQRGKGFKIALNVLNIGRIKLAGGVLGAAKKILSNAVNYSNEREQFGRPISKYGAIRYKLAESAIRCYVLEAATYRASMDIQEKIADLEKSGTPHFEAMRQGVEQFAPEAAMLKVFGSEVLDYVADEGVQVYGGMGYSAEAPMDRAYRDARINRIFEGTNEINRMLTVQMMLRKAMKGELDLMGPAMQVANELMSASGLDSSSDDGLLTKELEYIEKYKKAALMVAGSAAQKLMQSLGKEQEILLNIADMLISIYSSESVVLRAIKLASIKGEEAAKDEIAMAKVWVYDQADQINKWGKDALTAFATGDELKMMLMGLKRFTKVEPLNTKELRQQIAMTLIEKNNYAW